MQKKTAVVLINLGTPDSPKTGDVRKYLFQFLNDKRVIDLPYLLRKFLVNLIIVPFRAPKSAKIYKELWTDKGSPILLHTEALTEKVQSKLGEQFDVYYAMRYQSPSIESVLEKVRKTNPDEIICLPLYPHFAASSTGSTLAEVMRVIQQWWVIPQLKLLGQFYHNPTYIDLVCERAKPFDLNSYDHIIFSYHGLPTRQVDKVYDEGLCTDRDCENEVTRENLYCYKAACFATTRAIVQKLNIPEDKCTVGFQSRLDKNWLTPFSDKLVEEWGKKGAKRLLFFSPAFVADCLETTIEIGGEYQEIFEEFGGETVDLVPSLNAGDDWAQMITDLVKHEAT